MRYTVSYFQISMVSSCLALAIVVFQLRWMGGGGSVVGLVVWQLSRASSLLQNLVCRWGLERTMFKSQGGRKWRKFVSVREEEMHCREILSVRAFVQTLSTFTCSHFMQLGRIVQTSGAKLSLSIKSLAVCRYVLWIFQDLFAQTTSHFVVVFCGAKGVHLDLQHNVY